MSQFWIFAMGMVLGVNMGAVVLGLCRAKAGSA